MAHCVRHLFILFTSTNLNEDCCALFMMNYDTDDLMNDAIRCENATDYLALKSQRSTSVLLVFNSYNIGIFLELCLSTLIAKWKLVNVYG